MKRTIVFIIAILMVVSSLGFLGVQTQSDNLANGGNSSANKALTSTAVSTAVIPSNLQPKTLPSFQFNSLSGVLSQQAPISASYFPEYVLYNNGSVYDVVSATNGSTYLEIRNSNLSISQVVFVSNLYVTRAFNLGSDVLMSLFSYSSVWGYSYYTYEYHNGKVSNLSKNPALSGFQYQSVGGVYAGNYVLFLAHTNSSNGGPINYMYFYNVSTGSISNYSYLEKIDATFVYAAGSGNDLVVSGIEGSSTDMLAINVPENKTLATEYYNITDSNHSTSPSSMIYLDNNVYIGGYYANTSQNSFKTASAPFYDFNETTNQFTNYTNEIPTTGEFLSGGLATLGNSVVFPTISFFSGGSGFAITGTDIYRVFTNGTIENLTYLDPTQFDISTITGSGSAVYIFGASLYNGTNEQLIIYKNNSARVRFGPLATLLLSNPSFWTANVYDTSKGFLVTGGNGFAGYGGTKFFSPNNEAYNPGYFIGANQSGNMIYVTGELYGPHFGALMYQYNLSSDLINNVSNIPSSLEYHASFMQDVSVGSDLYILGRTGEGSSSAPSLILYVYNTSTKTFTNMTQFIPSQYRSIYFGNMVYDSGQLYFVITGQNGTNFFSLNPVTDKFTPLSSLLSAGFGFQPGYEYVSSKELMVTDGSNIFITGNKYSSNGIAVIDYNTTNNKSVDLSSYFDGYSATVSSATFFNNMVVIAGYENSNPVVLGLTVSGGYNVLNIGESIPTSFGSVNAISANSTAIFVAGGIFGSVNYGIITESTLYSYPIVFSETGLPTGQTWSLTINGKTSTTSTNYMVFYLPNGTFDYTVGSVNNFVPNPSSGQIVVSGSSQQINVVWTRNSYSVTFDEVGLSYRTQWQVTLGSQTIQSTGQSIVFNVKNGTYQFVIPQIGSSLAYPSAGNVTVSGNSVSLNVPFLTSNEINQGYVIVNENSTYQSLGLLWASQVASGNGSIGISGGNGFFLAKPFTSPQVIVPASQGYLNYVQWTGDSYIMGGNWYGPSSGVRVYQYFPSNNTLSDLTAILPANWTTEGPGYTLRSLSYGQGETLLIKDNSFSGVPAIGLISNGKFENITSSFQSLVNSVYTSDYANGNFLIVSDSNAYLLNATTLKVSEITGYTFSIPNGLGQNSQLTWNGSVFLLISGSTLYSINPKTLSESVVARTTNPFIFVNEVQGHTVLGAGNTTSTTIYYLSGNAPSPILSVKGQVTDFTQDGTGYLITGTAPGLNTLVMYYQPLSIDSFSTQGLPSGSLYQVVSSGVSELFTPSSTVGVVSFTPTKYNIVPPEGYSVSMSSFTSLSPGLTSSHVIHNLIFIKEKTYNVTFNEQGLPTGGDWNITIGGSTYSSTSSSIKIPEINGTYSYEISTGNSFSAFPSSGTVTVNGSGVSIATIEFSDSGSYTVTFSEGGLATGTTWSVTFNGLTQESTSNTIIFSSGAGTYSYSISSVQGYSAEESSGNIGVLGNVTQLVNFFSTGNKVTFKESGLPLNEQWSINTAGNDYTSTGSSVTVELPAGTFAYSVVSPSGYQSNITSGNVTVAQSSVTINLGFVKVSDYTVDFAESGLPSGTVWSVYFDGLSLSSNISEISAYVPNGTYNYTIGQLNGYASNISSGYLTVNGSSVKIMVNFSYEYNTTSGPDPSVMFTENGLTSGATWSVTLGETTEFSESSTISFSVTSGVYAYRVSSSGGYVPTVDSGNVFVSSSPVNIPVSFVQISYGKLSVNGNGAPSNVPWSIQIGNSHYTVTGSTVLSVPLGNYQYIVSPPTGYVTTDSSGFISIGSTGTSPLSINFVKSQVFPATFTASGISSNSAWGLSINGNIYTSTSETLSVPLVNGTYDYSIISPTGAVSAVSSGTFNINGNLLKESISFSQPVHVVEFSQSGIPSGTSWSVSINGNVYQSSSGTLYVPLMSGTYTYTIQSPQGFLSSIKQGSLTVSESNTVQNIAFSAIMHYTVTFHESGLSNNTNWTVNLNGQNVSSSNDNITFSMENGTYDYTVYHVGNLVPNPGSGNVIVNGQNLTVNVTFSISPSVTPPSHPNHDLLLEITIGVIVVALIGGTSVFMWRRK